MMEFVAEVEAGIDALPSRAVAPVRQFRRSLSRKLAQTGAPELLSIASRLVRRTGSHRRFVAYELVAHHRAARLALGQAELEDLGHGLASWDAVDTFACYLSGPAWRDGQIGDKVILGWARRADLWWRRTALVSTVMLARRGAPGDSKRVLTVCKLLAGDREDMVVKALSWALRELTKTDTPAVRKFLDDQKDSLAARVMREVKCKLETGLKNSRRKVISSG
jgi:3-methyladenine DNA glycosylase AlkD